MQKGTVKAGKQEDEGYRVDEIKQGETRGQLKRVSVASPRVGMQKMHLKKIVYLSTRGHSDRMRTCMF